MSEERSSASHSWDVLAGFTPPVPPDLVARAEEWSADTVPVTPARSASVVLLREGELGVETFLLHRHAQMPFAASMVVFPGGRVDPADGDPGDPKSVRRCAVRETAEETAVVLAVEDLRDWADWTTPAVEPRRYHTRFFVAVLPEGQQALDVSGETDSADWAMPTSALAAAEREAIALMPPTWSILTELAAAGSVAEIWRRAEGRVVKPVLPVLVHGKDGWSFSYPPPPLPG